LNLELKEINTNDLSGSNPFVSGNWASIKKENGWLSLAYIISIDENQYEMLILIRTIKLGYSLAYIPFAPYPLNGAELQLVVDNLEKISFRLLKNIPKSVFAIRYDFPFNYGNPEYIGNLDKHFIKMKDNSVQPVSTSFIQLESNIEEIRANYRKRARRYLKKNEASVEIEVWNGSLDELSQWYAIYKKTGLDDGFSVRSFSYVEKIMDTNYSKLILSKIDGKIVGGIIILCGIDVAVYLLGGSLKDCGYSVSYTLQDEAIKICKDLGIKYYDLFGIGSKKSKHLSSLNMFKTSFGGKTISRIPTFDYTIRPIAYFFFNLAEIIRYSFYR
jgi:lipid II:glycine glycyltransferase (peptidoglycan interpeptide bridge formation enzyme)